VEDHEAPSIAAPAAVQAATGSGARICGAVISDEALGKPVASDNCSVTLTRTGVPEGNLFPTGVTTITWTATDPSGNTSSATQAVTVTDNTAPVLTVPPAVTLGTGADATTCGKVVPDAALGAATASDNCSVTLTRTGVPAGNLFPTGVTTITYTATDPSGNAVSATQLVTIADTTPPKVTAADLTRPTDAGTCAATIAALGAAATDNCGTPALAGVRADGLALSDPFPKGSTTILWTATDAAGNTSTATQAITVTNAVPVAEITAPVSGLVVPVGAPVSFTGNFSDDSGDAHTAAWSLDALTCAGTVDEGARTVSGSMAFASAGVYRVTLTVTDQCGSSATATQVGGLDAMIVVYDPNAGFVTGGGWIQSPAGAYAADPSLTGKANFGFVSRYKRGATTPTGDTEFQFKAGGLDFHSASYDWLVISGARAQYKGTGTVNGAGSYGFLLSAVDGDVLGGGAKDKFRIKITDRASGLVVYDNMMGAADTSVASTVLGGGSIQIQTNGGNKAGASIGATLDAFATSAAPATNGLAQNRPNPFNPETSIRFSMSRAGYASLRVYDVRGALVRTLVDTALPEGAHEVRWNGLDERGGRVPTGVYYALFETAGYRDRIRMVLIK
ncbi:MAG: HYR domain-containing protein, partial [Bacteroidota bacterium]